MGSPKSQVEFYLDLCVSVVRCDPLGLSTQKTLERDVRTLSSRTLSEGLSFLTKTLPKLGKALDQALECSTFTMPREFSGHRGYPDFLQDYFKVVFSDDGHLLEDANAAAIKHLRQILYVLYKLELPFSKEDESRVVDSFLSSDEEIKSVTNRFLNHLNFVQVAKDLISDVVGSFDPFDIVPRHGPGAVSTGERLDEKWEFSRLYRDIHRVFPYYEYFMVGWSSELIDRLSWYKSLARHDSGCAKVVLVPKDSRGPRLISAEPLEYQWIQQGIGRKLMSHLEANRHSGGYVNFTHQKINQELALLHSMERGYATLDLKDASDRVALSLVEVLFSHEPKVLRALKAARSTSTTLPDGRVVPLAKFAPMGSALCFPVEALCFWALIVGAISTRLGRAHAEKLVYVYGDDIIVPTDLAELSMQALELVGLKVNQSKCCIKGFFRESCGVDAYKGIDVTPIRVRTLWTGRRSDGASYVSYLSTLNQMRAKGYKSVARWLEGKLATVFGVIPRAPAGSSFPAIEVSTVAEASQFNSVNFPCRWNEHYQRLEFKVPTAVSAKKTSKLDGWTRLLRNVNSGVGENPSQVIVPRSMKTKTRWQAV